MRTIAELVFLHALDLIVDSEPVPSCFLVPRLLSPVHLQQRNYHDASVSIC
jgi:hypothetical protein